MMTLKITCSTCGKECPGELDMTTTDDFELAGLAERIEADGCGWPAWVFQNNDGNLDIYCSEECAK